MNKYETTTPNTCNFKCLFTYVYFIVQEFDIHSTLYDQYAKHDNHIININESRGFTPQKDSNYHITLINPQTKEATFALFVGVVGSCWLGEKGNFKKVSFANTYVDPFWKIPSSLEITKKSCHHGVNIRPKNGLT